MPYSTTLATKIEKAIVHAFDLNELRAGFHNIRGDTGETVDKFRLDAICVIQLMNHYWQPVTIALTHQYGWSDDIKDETEFLHECKGLLLIPALRPPLERDFGGINPLRAIDMQWPIPVLTCLENMNLIPDSPLALALGGGNHDYVVHTYTHRGYACLSYSGTPQSKSMHEFYDALITTINQMAKIIDDDEISSLIDHGQAWINRI